MGKELLRDNKWDYYVKGVWKNIYIFTLSSISGVQLNNAVMEEVLLHFIPIKHKHGNNTLPSISSNVNVE